MDNKIKHETVQFVAAGLYALLTPEFHKVFPKIWISNYYDIFYFGC